MQIQFLWWKDCPSHTEAWQRLHTVLDQLAVQPQVERIEIRTEAEAEQWRFPGSPTILVNGQDIDSDAPTVYRLTCRLYFREDGRPSPLPSETMMKRAILNADKER
jgi:hypothetical protein